MSETLSKEEALEIAARGLRDPVFFLKFFLHHWFPKDIPWVHRGLLALLTKQTDFLAEYGELDKIVSHFVWKTNWDDPDETPKPIFTVNEDGSVDMLYTKFLLEMMPRGFSKTTLCNAVVLYWIVYQDCKFPVYISETQTHASTQLKNVKGQLENNERIKLVFGNLKPEQRQGKTWTDDVIQTTNGVTVAARGRGGQVRGLNVDAQRPDRILLDDVEDKESVRTQDQRDKVLTWFYADVIPALPEMDDEARIIALGTLLHRDALLMRLRGDPDWTVTVFGVRDHSGAPLWKEMMPEWKIEAKKKSYARVGKLNVYYMEYENAIRNDEEAKFKQEFIIYSPVDHKSLVKAIAMDPAISDEVSACDCSYGVVGMSETGLITVLDYFGEPGMTPRAQIDKYFELVFRWEPNKHGVESIAYQKALVHLLREEMFRKGRIHGAKAYFEIIPITHSNNQSKFERVEGILQPRYAAGYMRHFRRFPDLEVQLLDWPNGKLDGPDVIAMAVSLLDPYAAFGAGDEKDLGEDQYPPLGEVLKGNWRGA